VHAVSTLDPSKQPATSLTPAQMKELRTHIESEISERLREEYEKEVEEELQRVEEEFDQKFAEQRQHAEVDRAKLQKQLTEIEEKFDERVEAALQQRLDDDRRANASLNEEMRTHFQQQLATRIAELEAEHKKHVEADRLQHAEEIARREMALQQAVEKQRDEMKEREAELRIREQELRIELKEVNDQLRGNASPNPMRPTSIEQAQELQRKFEHDAVLASAEAAHNATLIRMQAAEIELLKTRQQELKSAMARSSKSPDVSEVLSQQLEVQLRAKETEVSELQVREDEHINKNSLADQILCLYFIGSAS
jgi:hypothetical protein